MSATEAARDVIAAHHAEYDDRTYHLVCTCGEQWPALREDYEAEIALHAAHQLDALTEQGFAVVKYPEPHPREDIGEVTTRWEDALPHTVDVWDDNRDQVQLSYNFEPSEPLTPSESRYLGSALLAAAAYAEAGEDRG